MWKTKSRRPGIGFLLILQILQILNFTYNNYKSAGMLQRRYMLKVNRYYIILCYHSKCFSRRSFYCVVAFVYILFTQYSTDTEWGTIENNTADGLFEQLYNEQADFGLGCLYKWYFDEFETSYGIAKSGVTILVPVATYIRYFLCISPKLCYNNFCLYFIE